MCWTFHKLLCLLLSLKAFVDNLSDFSCCGSVISGHVYGLWSLSFGFCVEPAMERQATLQPVFNVFGVPELLQQQFLIQYSRDGIFICSIFYESRAICASTFDPLEVRNIHKFDTLRYTYLFYWD